MRSWTPAPVLVTTGPVMVVSVAQAHAGAGDFDQAIGAFEAAITENGRAGASGFETQSAAALERLHEIITDGVRPPS